MAASASRQRHAFTVNLAISVAVTAFVLLLTQDVLIEFPPLKRAELSLIDLRFRRRGAILSPRDTSKIAIVEVSQESFKSLPDPWPWPKRYYARLVRNLKRAGARAIGLDVIFSSMDVRNQRDDEDFRRAMKETGCVVLTGKLETERRQYIKREGSENYGNVYIDPPAL